MSVIGLLLASNSAFAADVTQPKGIGLIKDNQLTELRINRGKTNDWIKHDDKHNGQGEIASSKNTAFDDEGSARIRFLSADDNFSATPGLSQTISGLEKNTQYVYSLYYRDKKGNSSASSLEFGVKSLNGKILGDNTVHIKDLANNPKGSADKSFKLISTTFNSGDNTSVEVFAFMHIDKAKLDLKGDIGKETEVRVDEFSLSKKGN